MARSVWPAFLALVGDVVLTGLGVFAILWVRLGAEGFRSATSVSAQEFRDFMVVLAVWGAVMAAIAVAALVRKRWEIAVVQVVVALLVLVPASVYFSHAYHEAYPPRPDRGVLQPGGYCPHGNCQGG